MGKIAFDFRTNRLTGIYRHGTALLPRLKAMVSGSDIKLYVLYMPDMEAGHLTKLANQIRSDNIELVMVQEDRGFLRDSPWLRRWLIENQVDLFHSINYLVDIHCPIPFTYTIHDLIRLKFPDLSYSEATFKAEFGGYEFEKMKATYEVIRSRDSEAHIERNKGQSFDVYFAAVTRYLANRSAHIVTVSETVKEDIVQILRVPPAKVSVIANAADPVHFYPRQPAEVAAALKKFRVPTHYCLYVGNSHPHKRLPQLLHTLALCQGELPQDARFVICGLESNIDGKLHRLIDAYHLKRFLIFTGEVTDDELACLYSRARALVVSSKDEGFCLPAVEALACGSEVIAPDIEIMHETIGDIGHFYQCDDVWSLAECLRKAFNGQLPRKAKKFDNRFSWDRSARHLYDLLLRVSASKTQFRCTDPEGLEKY